MTDGFLLKSYDRLFSASDLAASLTRLGRVDAVKANAGERGQGRPSSVSPSMTQFLLMIRVSSARALGMTCDGISNRGRCSPT